MQVLPQCGHAVHEDAPDKVSPMFDDCESFADNCESNLGCHRRYNKPVCQPMRRSQMQLH